MINVTTAIITLESIKETSIRLNVIPITNASILVAIESIINVFSEFNVTSSVFSFSLKDLIEWEFNKRNIGGDVLVYHNKGKVQKDEREVCIRMNNGMLCGFTLKRLFEFDGKGAEPEVGKRLARAFVEAGIDVPQEVFVGLFEKVFEGE